MKETPLLTRAAGRVNHHERPHFLPIKKKFKLTDNDLDTYLDLIRLFATLEDNPSVLNQEEISDIFGIKLTRFGQDSLRLKKAGLITKARKRTPDGWLMKIEILPPGLTYILLITNFHPN